MSSPTWKIALMVQIQTIYRSLSYRDRLALSRFLLETAAKISASADLHNIPQKTTMKISKRID